MRPVLPAWQAARVSPKASRDCRALIDLQLSTKQEPSIEGGRICKERDREGHGRALK